MPARCDASKIRMLMNDRLMTPAQLSESSGLSSSTINRILHEKDYRTSDATLNLISRALNCSPFDLLRQDAIDSMIHTETEHAVTDVVVEAVTEAITVVADELTPAQDAPAPQAIAQAVPPLEVNVPPVLDVAAYIDYIRTATDEKVQAVNDRLSDMRKARNLWRGCTLALLIVLLAFFSYFVWEILNPGSGLTNLLRQIYISTAF